MRDANFVTAETIKPLLDEATEILKIVSKARKNSKGN